MNVKRRVSQERLSEGQVRTHRDVTFGVAARSHQDLHRLATQLRILAQGSNVQRLAAIARRKMDCTGLEGENNIDESTGAICDGVVQRCKPHILAVVALQARSSLQEEATNLGRGIIDLIREVAHIIEDGHAIGRLGVHILRTHLPAVIVLVDRVGIPPPVEKPTDRANFARHAELEDLARVEGLIRDVSRAARCPGRFGRGP